MILFALPYSFHRTLAQAAAPISATPAPTPAIPNAPKSLPFGTVHMMGADVPILELGIAAATIVGALWVVKSGVLALDRA